jgi:hypothetical protein
MGICSHEQFGQIVVQKPHLLLQHTMRYESNMILNLNLKIVTGLEPARQTKEWKVGGDNLLAVFYINGV